MASLGLNNLPARTRLSTALTFLPNVDRKTARAILQLAGLSSDLLTDDLTAADLQTLRQAHAALVGAAPGAQAAAEGEPRSAGRRAVQRQLDAIGDLPLSQQMVAYGPYVNRVRLLLRRYLLALDPYEQRQTGVEDDGSTRKSLAARCLSGESLAPEILDQIKEIDRQLDATYASLAASGNEERFERVRREFGLTDVECDILWVMLASELQPEFLWLYRALWQVSDRTTFDRTFLFHAIDPFGNRNKELFEAFRPISTLFANRLIVVVSRSGPIESGGRYLPSRRLVEHLLDIESALPNIGGFVAVYRPTDALREATEDPALSKKMLKRLKTGFVRNKRFVLLGPDNTGPLRLARRVVGDTGNTLIEVHMKQLLEGGTDAFVQLLGEARLRRAGIYFDGIDALDGKDVDPTLRRSFFLLFKAEGVPQFYRSPYGLSADLRLQLVREMGAVELKLQLPEVEVRQAIWRECLKEHFDEEKADELAYVARAYPFGVDDIHRAVDLAIVQAETRSLRKPKVKPSDVETACHLLSGSRMGQLARRVEIRATWDDVVLPVDTRRVIEEVKSFGLHRERVFEEFGYGAKMSYGKGLTAMFWGPSGTGKTMVSGLIARELGLELYQVDLSSLVSKYIGETEQRLAQLFDEAESGGMALLFDEADSLFASRTEVKSSVDRYANLEVNFLLQKMESHEGLVILTTNFPSSIDSAFMRRIRFKAEFPEPGSEERAQLWQKMIPKGAPMEDDINFEAIGEVYELTGGEIRNAILRAAFYAVDAGTSLNMEHIERSAQVEYKELGRLINTSAADWARKKAERERLDRERAQSSDEELDTPQAKTLIEAERERRRRR